MVPDRRMFLSSVCSMRCFFTNCSDWGTGQNETTTKKAAGFWFYSLVQFTGATHLGLPNTIFLPTGTYINVPGPWGLRQEAEPEAMAYGCIHKHRCKHKSLNELVQLVVQGSKRKSKGGELLVAHDMFLSEVQSVAHLSAMSRCARCCFASGMGQTSLPETGLMKPCL